MKKVRLNLQLSQELDEILQQMAQENGATKTDVIRNALALMKAAHDNKKKGRHLGFASDSSKLDTEIVGAF